MNYKAFTLIELLVVLSIVGILFTFIFIETDHSINSGKDAKRKSDVALLVSAVFSYLSESTSLPISSQCSINNGCSSEINEIFEIQLGGIPTDPDGLFYNYQSDGTDCIISAVLSNSSIYNYSCSLGLSVGGNGTTIQLAGRTCYTIHYVYPASASGVYWINPDNNGNTSNAFQAYCDMTTDGGGWTLVAGIEATNKNHLNTAAVGGWDSQSYVPDINSKGKYSDAVINSINLKLNKNSFRLKTASRIGYVSNACNFVANFNSANCGRFTLSVDGDGTGDGDSQRSMGCCYPLETCMAYGIIPYGASYPGADVGCGGGSYPGTLWVR